MQKQKVTLRAEPSDTSGTITFFFLPGCNENSRESNQICVTFLEP